MNFIIKLTPHAKQVRRGSRVIALIILMSVLDEGGLTVLYPGCFIPRKKPQYQLQRRLGGNDSWSEQVRRK